MKIEFIRKFRDKQIGDVEDVPDRVAHRYVDRGMAKFIKVKSKRKKKYESPFSKSKG